MEGKLTLKIYERHIWLGNGMIVEVVSILSA